MKLYSILLFATILFCSCKNISTYPINQPIASLTDDRILGKWKFEEDTNKNNYYFVEPPFEGDEYQYHVKFYNRGGTNRTYEDNIYFSEVNNISFINLPYWEKNFTNRGWMFLKILDFNSSGDKITAAVVGDETMRSLKNSDEVTQFIAAHINDAKFYSDTIHLYKFSK